LRCPIPDLSLHRKLFFAMILYSCPIAVEPQGKRYYAYSDDLPAVCGLGKSIEKAKKSIPLSSSFPHPVPISYWF
jgi:hypothetical protein